MRDATDREKVAFLAWLAGRVSNTQELAARGFTLRVGPAMEFNPEPFVFAVSEEELARICRTLTS